MNSDIRKAVRMAVAHALLNCNAQEEKAGSAKYKKTFALAKATEKALDMYPKAFTREAKVAVLDATELVGMTLDDLLGTAEHISLETILKEACDGKVELED